ncbi:hypothetical protein C8R43DRAFT_1136348 [Mycena crocata]|nr:hypothetical protein C8R43DRAFT_1136348 [Mycena crocata]
MTGREMPADGGTPRIAPMKFLAKEGATTSPDWGADLDITALYRPANEVATREKSWTVGNGGNRRAYMLLYKYEPGNDCYGVETPGRSMCSQMALTWVGGWADII